ncbi:MAG: T9SS type A sorting domain-containing protein [Dyadobacter sp.]|uniref:T9SS type A sorting domain-containing protein n=1 Tax=Dyadobacter sp. TaxID=1914288 RepID=UPI001B0FDF1D|nr:T9SS type A sorting domain-containing protein [Dyadobacter sp.]MBO9616370.1 T9SS type A sorting domain-containing protein [Dyadobacter sp.]
MRRVLRILALLCVLLTGMDSLHAQRRRIFTDRLAFGKVTYPSTAVVTANTVDGYVKVTGSNRFVFPTSDNSVYRPFAASADGTTGAYFSANPAIGITSSHKGGNYPPLPTGAPFSATSKDANVGKISTQEYWDINGATATKITLSWHLESGMSTLAPSGNLSKVYIIGWNGSKWVKVPSTVDPVSLFGGTSYISAGSMTTNAAIVPNTYLAYTFGADLSSTREMAPGADSALVSSDGTEILKPQNNSLDEMHTAVYPNPARDRIFVRNSKSIKQMSVVDMSGRSIISVNRNYERGIDVNSLPAGVYLVNIQDDKGKTTSRKIIINK